jgi:hypothetical protein
MNGLPADYDEAVDALLARCPELASPWRDLCRDMKQDTAEGVGIYVVFGQIILPFLLYALEGHGKQRDFVTIGNRQVAMPRADDHRSHFRDQPQWADIPARGDERLDDLIHRLYEVLDLWAASPDVNLRHAVFIEMVEAGHSDLRVEDLVRNGGPALKVIAERGTAQ